MRAGVTIAIDISVFCTGSNMAALHMYLALEDAGWTPELLNHPGCAPWFTDVTALASRFRVRNEFRADDAPLDLLVEVAWEVLPDTRPKLARRVVQLLRRPILFAELEACSYPRRAPASRTKHVDALWMWDANTTAADEGYARLVYPNVQVVRIPFIWYPDVMDAAKTHYSIPDWPGRAQVQDGALSDTAERWALHVCESNSTVTSSAVVPLGVCRDLMATSIFNPEHKGFRFSWMVHNMDTLKSRPFFMSNVFGNMFAADMSKNLVGRLVVPSLAAERCCLLAHQRFNPLRILYIDAAWVNAPMVHNSPALPAVAGYAYDGNDIGGAVRAVLQMNTDYGVGAGYFAPGAAEARRAWIMETYVPRGNERLLSRLREALAAPAVPVPVAEPQGRMQALALPPSLNLMPTTRWCVMVLNVGSISYAGPAEAVLRSYFTRHGMSAQFVTEAPSHVPELSGVHPSWWKLLAHRILPGYDFIVCWDLDLLPRYRDVKLDGIFGDMTRLCMARDTSLLLFGPNVHYPNFKYNGGLVGLPASLAPFAEDVFAGCERKNETDCWEQFPLNDAIAKRGINVLELPPDINVLCHPQPAFYTARLMHFTLAVNAKQLILEYAARYLEVEQPIARNAIGFSDFWEGFQPDYNFFTLMLDDYCTRHGQRWRHQPTLALIVGPYTNAHASSSLPKILYTAECSRPRNDVGIVLNMGFDWCDKNYVRLPLWQLNIDWFCADVTRIVNPKPIPARLLTHPDPAAMKGRPRFCGFVVSNPSNELRNEAFRQLSSYKHVDSAGALFNNVGGKLEGGPGGGGGELVKLEFFKTCKFAIVFENTAHPGYVTEKLLHAKAAGCIPIYWGAPDVGRDFNTAAFIHARDYAPPNQPDAIDWPRLIAAVQEVDTDRRKWTAMYMTPLVTDEQLAAVRASFDVVAARILNIARPIAHVCDSWLINLARRPDRMTRFHAHHKDEDVASVKRVDAVDGKALTMTPEIAHLFRNNSFHWKKGVIGCDMSHYRLWQQLAARPEPDAAFLVFEDDVQLVEGWRETWAGLTIPPDADVVYLGGVLPPNRPLFDTCTGGFTPLAPHPNSEPADTAAIVRFKPNTAFGQSQPTPYFHMCTYAYFIRRAGAQKLLSLIEREGFGLVVDHMMCNRWDLLNLYVTKPLLAGCYQDNDEVYKASSFNDYARKDAADTDIWADADCFTPADLAGPATPLQWMTALGLTNGVTLEQAFSIIAQRLGNDLWRLFDACECLGMNEHAFRIVRCMVENMTPDTVVGERELGLLRRAAALLGRCEAELTPDFMSGLRPHLTRAVEEHPMIGGMFDKWTRHATGPGRPCLMLPNAAGQTHADGPEWEADWLAEVLPYIPAWSTYNKADSVRSDHPVFVMSRPGPAAFAALLRYEEHKQPFDLIHLSDEWANDALWAYSLTQCKRVIRNYGRDDVPADAVTKVRTIPLGYKRGFWSDVSTGANKTMQVRQWAWCFAGDVNKADRAAMLTAMRASPQLRPGREHVTSGWNAADCLSTHEYRDMMRQSEFAPCPMGNWNVESFRIWEALEAGAIPLIVYPTPNQTGPYFEMLLGKDHQLPIYADWPTAATAAAALIDNPTALGTLRARLTAWWAAHKVEVRAALT